MRFFLLLACCAISLNTSAQFWKKKAIRFPAIAQVDAYSIPKIATPAPVVKSNITYVNRTLPTVFDFNKDREYQEASYNFTDLASLYLLHNRFSEAKWYLLQSISLSHDAKLKLANLLTLAGIKIDLGETSLAKTDLQAARMLANANGLKADVIEIDKRLFALSNSKPLLVKPELRYSEAVEAAARKTAALKAL
jgi:energy-converting hydrogenase A subunit M